MNTGASFTIVDAMEQTGNSLVAVAWDPATLPASEDRPARLQADLSAELVSYAAQSGMLLISDKGEALQINKPWMMRLTRTDNHLLLHFVDLETDHSLIPVHSAYIAEIRCGPTDDPFLSLRAFCSDSHLAAAGPAENVLAIAGPSSPGLQEYKPDLSQQRFYVFNTGQFAYHFRQFVQAALADTVPAPLFPVTPLAITACAGRTTAPAL